MIWPNKSVPATLYSKSLTNYAEKLILSELDHIQSEIKHNVPEPSINLQWLVMEYEV